MEKKQSALRYGMRLVIYGDEDFFGPGVRLLLAHLEETGSVRQSCAIMNMAYSKAWKMLKKAEQNLGYPLVEGSVGGTGGGKSVITENGLAFIRRYDAFVSEASEIADMLFCKHFDR